MTFTTNISSLPLQSLIYYHFSLPLTTTEYRLNRKFPTFLFFWLEDGKVLPHRKMYLFDTRPEWRKCVFSSINKTLLWWQILKYYHINWIENKWSFIIQPIKGQKWEKWNNNNNEEKLWKLFFFFKNRKFGYIFQE